MTALRSSAVEVGGRPERISSSSPERPRSLKRLSQKRTVASHRPILAAISGALRPSTACWMICARRTSPAPSFCERVIRASLGASSSLNARTRRVIATSPARTSVPCNAPDLEKSHPTCRMHHLGSFIGYSAAFPLLLKTQFPEITVAIAFLGPLVGSLIRPVGGLLADRIGGAKVTFWNFVAMGAATIGVMYFIEVKSFAGFLAMFLVLFVTTGIGNGSTYRMIPSIFREAKLAAAKGEGESGRLAAIKAAALESAAALGFIGAIGACGGYLIPRGFGASIAATGGPYLALEIFLLFYITCIALTWWYYLRKTSSLAKARV